MARKVLGVLVIVVLLLNATPASARTIEVDRGRARSSGGFASASASGTVDDPKALIVEVTSRPARASSPVRTRIRKKLNMPYADPDYCTFAATISLSDGRGRIAVVLLARV